MLYPLTFVILLSMIKDIFEDYKRHKSDNVENRRMVMIQTADGQVRGSEWSALRVGQIVKVMEGEYFPADLILLETSESQGVCYVETKNLDGETNLKMKHTSKDFLGQSIT